MPSSNILCRIGCKYGAVLLTSGEKGRRFATPNSEILIHQPLIGGNGISGQTTEIKIHADHMVKTRDKLNKLLSDRTGQSLEVIEKDTERDNYMTAEEALKYGLIDGILEKRNLLAFFIYFICNDTRNFYLLGIILTYFEWKFLFMFI